MVEKRFFRQPNIITNLATSLNLSMAHYSKNLQTFHIWPTALTPKNSAISAETINPSINNKFFMPFFINLASPQPKFYLFYTYNTLYNYSNILFHTKKDIVSPSEGFSESLPYQPFELNTFQK